MKNITLKLSIFSMILLSTFLWSCKEEPLINNSEGEYGRNLILADSSDFSYLSYDLIGQWHNEYLDSLYERILNEEYDFPNSEGYLDTTTINFSVYFIENIKGKDAFGMDTVVPHPSQVPTSMSEFINSNTFSSQTNSILNNINIAINLLDNNDDLIAYQTTINSLKNQASSISVLNEKYMLLSCLSVAQYSAEYWWDTTNVNKWDALEPTEYINNSNEKTQLFKSEKNVMNDKLLYSVHNKEILLSDVLASGAGAVDGALIGSAAGPWGAIAGAMAGACVGGGAGSLSSAIVDWAVSTFWD